MRIVNAREDSRSQEPETAEGRGLRVVGGGGLGSTLQHWLGRVELALLGQQN